MFFILGYWLLHCHLDFHVETGMAVLFKIGEDSDFPPVPNNFPQCGNYKTNDYENENEIPSYEIAQTNYVAYKVIMDTNPNPNEFQKLWNSIKKVLQPSSTNSGFKEESELFSLLLLQILLVVSFYF